MGETERRTELEKVGRKQNFRERYKRGLNVRERKGDKEARFEEGRSPSVVGEDTGCQGEVMLKDQSELYSS